MVCKEQDSLSVRNQCELLNLNRSTLYYKAVKPDAETLELMRLVDKIFLERPYLGARRIRQLLKTGRQTCDSQKSTSANETDGIGDHLQKATH